MSPLLCWCCCRWPAAFWVHVCSTRASTKFVVAPALAVEHFQNDTISKPDWAPPSWLFSPVWSVLYLMIGVASVLVVRHGVNWHTGVAMTLYAVQLMLNWLWTPVFFGFGMFAAVC
jgi:tryptophan-rich sensory protein